MKYLVQEIHFYVIRVQSGSGYKFKGHKFKRSITFHWDEQLVLSGKEGLPRESLNEVKRSIQKLSKSNGQLEIMERDAIMIMVSCWRILQHQGDGMI
jgi:hypothetical protein